MSRLLIDKSLFCVCVLCRYELTHSKYVDKLPAGKHSTKGLGRTASTTDGHKTTEEGVVIPMHGQGLLHSRRQYCRSYIVCALYIVLIIIVSR